MNTLTMIALVLSLTQVVKIKILGERFKLKRWQNFILSAVVSAGVVAYVTLKPGSLGESIPFDLWSYLTQVGEVIAGAFLGYQGLKIPARTKK